MSPIDPKLTQAVAEWMGTFTYPLTSTGALQAAKLRYGLGVLKQKFLLEVPYEASIRDLVDCYKAFDIDEVDRLGYQKAAKRMVGASPENVEDVARKTYDEIAKRLSLYSSEELFSLGIVRTSDFIDRPNDAALWTAIYDGLTGTETLVVGYADSLPPNHPLLRYGDPGYGNRYLYKPKRGLSGKESWAFVLGFPTTVSIGKQGDGIRSAARPFYWLDGSVLTLTWILATELQSKQAEWKRQEKWEETQREFKVQEEAIKKTPGDMDYSMQAIRELERKYDVLERKYDALNK